MSPRLLAVLALPLPLVAAAAQQQIFQSTAPGSLQQYGTAQPVDLFQLAYNGESYHRRNVQTRGVVDILDPTAGYFALSEGGVRVMLIPMEGGDGPLRLVGTRVEVTGVARVLVAHQQRFPGCGLESKCNDPDLPALPDHRIDWPKVSVTIFSMSDVETGATVGRGPAGIGIAELLRQPERHAGKSVRVVGLFRGRNLFGDMPGAPPTAQDWVIKDDGGAIWVTGKKPQGKGWSLDPSYKGDTVRWLEVTGKLENKTGVTVLRASRVILTRAPGVAEREAR
jgi:hypothetical protein